MEQRPWQRLRTLLAWCDRGLMRLASLVVVVTTSLLVLLVLFLVLDRTAIKTAFMGTHELALMAAMWLYMVGAVVAMRNREHITVDYLASRLTGARPRALHALLVASVVLACSLFFLWLARDMLAWSARRPQTTPALGLPLLAAQWALVVAALFSVLYGLRDWVLALLAIQRAFSPSVATGRNP